MKTQETKKGNSELLLALQELEEQKGISKDVLIAAIEAALIAAYKRNFNVATNVKVEIDSNTGEYHVYSEKKVVEEVFDPALEISLEDARKINEYYEVDDTLRIEVTPASFGRIAAQTAKQVVVQRIREAERNMVYDRYIEKENEIVSAVVTRVDKGSVFITINGTEGVIRQPDQMPGEVYIPGKTIRVYVGKVNRTPRGPQIFASRNDPNLVKRLFELEVPEIADNIVTIKSVAREAGQRSKIAVYSEQANIDPIGACVGPKGQRIQKVVNELNGERVDVIPWSMDPIEYISNALRPSRVTMVQVNEEGKEAKVTVPDSQLSLAIGKEGQNARLAAKLTGFKIDIKSQSQMMDQYFGPDNSSDADDISSFDSSLYGSEDGLY